MCLATNKLPRIADRTIYAIKAFDTRSGNTLFSPYVGHKWRIGKEENATLSPAGIITSNSFRFNTGLHAFTGMRGLKKNLNDFFRYIALVKIPKGTRFAISSDGDTLVAERMEVVRILGKTVIKDTGGFTSDVTFSYAGPNLPTNAMAVFKTSPISKSFKRAVDKAMRGRRELL